MIDTWSRLSTQSGRRVTLSCNKRRYTGNGIGVDGMSIETVEQSEGGDQDFLERIQRSLQDKTARRTIRESRMREDRASVSMRGD